ncbi:MAG: hypothetical protein V1944_02600 [Candidatus Aenigmatarchaeota archaeon]
MKVLKSIDPMSMARVAAVLMAIWGLVVGLMIVLGLSVADYTGRIFSGFEMMGLSPAVGILSIIVFPIVYGITGFVGGYILAWLYNYVAKKVGGVKLDL